jgi:hypothetical protein
MSHMSSMSTAPKPKAMASKKPSAMATKKPAM